jgi:hypothetical protein
MKEKPPMPNPMLDDIYKKLCESGGQPNQEENGRPVYSLDFHGTAEEYEAVRRRLLELTPQTTISIPIHLSLYPNEPAGSSRLHTTACGIWGDHVTSDPKQVECRNCRRTRQWKATRKAKPS